MLKQHCRSSFCFSITALARLILNGIATGLCGAFLGSGARSGRLALRLFPYRLCARQLVDDGGPGAAVKASLPPLLAGEIVGAAVIALPILMTMMLAQDSNRPQIDLEGEYAALILCCF